MDTSSKPDGGAVLPFAPRTVVCPLCHGRGWLRRDVPTSDPLFGEPLLCSCKEREVQERRARRVLERSHLSAMHTMTFDTFDPDPEHQRAYERAREFAANPRGWLILMGMYGTGKTHLAVAIGNYRLAFGENVVFMVVPDLLDHLRATFNPASDITYDDLFDGVRTAPLLILDDLGTQSTSPWAEEKLYQIFNYRYNQRLPTVITTNKALDEFSGPIGSRMADPQLSIHVAINAKDFRGGGRDAPRPRPDSRSSRSR